MKVDQMSLHQLAVLAASVTAEIARRTAVSYAPEKVINSEHAPEMKIPDAVKAPTRSEIEVIKDVLRAVKKGSYMKADRKDWYRGIAKQYPEFFAAKGWPDSLRGNLSDFVKYGRIE